jgi:hypothetical protein
VCISAERTGLGALRADPRPGHTARTAARFAFPVGLPTIAARVRGTVTTMRGLMKRLALAAGAVALGVCAGTYAEPGNNGRVPGRSGGGRRGTKPAADADRPGWDAVRHAGFGRLVSQR